MTQSSLLDFIRRQSLGVLSTISPEGSPQSALVGIGVTNDLELVFDTLKSTRKYGNLLANPAVSLVIGWSGETTVQYEGEAFEPVGEELARFRAAYFEKWTDGPNRLSWPGIVHIAVRPKWIRYSDFDQRPPLIEEFWFESKL